MPFYIGEPYWWLLICSLIRFFLFICLRPYVVSHFYIYVNTKHTFPSNCGEQLPQQQEHQHSIHKRNANFIIHIFMERKKQKFFLFHKKKRWPEALANRPAATHMRTVFSAFCFFLYLPSTYIDSFVSTKTILTAFSLYSVSYALSNRIA